MREKQIEQRLVKAVKAQNGMCPKLVSPGTDGMPDRMVLLPDGKLSFVEVKAPHIGRNTEVITVPSVIKLKSGQCETVFDLDGLLYLVEQHMGDEARRLLEDFTAPEDDAAEYIDSLEKENKRLRDHHHEVMEDLRVQSETIARLIQKPEIDRSALSTVAGIIGRTTWREINVG